MNNVLNFKFENLKMKKWKYPEIVKQIQKVKMRLSSRKFNNIEMKITKGVKNTNYHMNIMYQSVSFQVTSKPNANFSDFYTLV